MNCPPLALVAEGRKTSRQYYKRLSRTTGSIAVKDVTSYALNTNEDGQPDTTSIGRTTPMQTEPHGAKRITPKDNSFARATALRNIYTVRNGSPKYVVDRVLDHCYTSDDLEYKIHWYRYPLEDGIWELYVKNQNHSAKRSQRPLKAPPIPRRKIAAISDIEAASLPQNTGNRSWTSSSTRGSH